MLRSTDRILLLTLPLLVFLVFAAYKNDRIIYYLFLKNNSDLNTVGLFQKTEGDVRKRQNQGFIWTTVNPGDSLNIKDTVFVGDQGHAQIILDTDTNVEILENSLLTVYGNGSKSPVLLLSNGAIKASSVSGKEINLKSRFSETQTIVLNAKEFEFKSESIDSAQENLAVQNPAPSSALSGGAKAKDSITDDAAKLTNASDSDDTTKLSKDSVPDKNIQILYIGMGVLYMLVIVGVIIDTRFGKKRD